MLPTEDPLEANKNTEYFLEYVQKSNKIEESQEEGEVEPVREVFYAMGILLSGFLFPVVWLAGFLYLHSAITPAKVISLLSVIFFFLFVATLLLFFALFVLVVFVILVVFLTTLDKP